MPEGTRAPYIYLVQMDIPAEHEADFNRVYDTEHVPEILKVPGVRGCTRYVLETDQQGRHGALSRTVRDGLRRRDGEPRLAEGSEIGDWAPKIRPHTTNRSHTVMRKIG